VTISGVVWGIIIFSEQHSLWVWASIVVMMIGLVLVTPERRTETMVATSSTQPDSS
jgi:drug/metabolite transporter (DMT)-like permease